MTLSTVPTAEDTISECNIRSSRLRIPIRSFDMQVFWGQRSLSYNHILESCQLMKGSIEETKTNTPSDEHTPSISLVHTCSFRTVPGTSRSGHCMIIPHGMITSICNLTCVERRGLPGSAPPLSSLAESILSRSPPLSGLTSSNVEDTGRYSPSVFAPKCSTQWITESRSGTILGI